VRVGIEFEDVSDTERSIVDLLERDNLIPPPGTDQQTDQQT
jgi:hypothetical protein